MTDRSKWIAPALPPPAPPVARRQVVTGLIDRESIRLVIDALYEHSYAYEWQGEVESRQ